MKKLKQLLLITALVAGISVFASAQKQDKKPPPKDPPPTIPVKPEKKPKEDKPSDKKPQLMKYKSNYTIILV